MVLEAGKLLQAGSGVGRDQSHVWAGFMLLHRLSVRNAVLWMRNDKDGRGAYFVTQNLLVFTLWLDHFCMRSSPLCLAH
jgi:hypothetical protein